MLSVTIGLLTYAAEAPILTRDELLMQKGAYLQLLQTQQNEAQQKIAEIDAKIAALDAGKAPADKKLSDVKK